MILAKVVGGLGNQLFIYAAAKTLAKKNETTLKLDISDYKNEGLRNFQLDYFNTNYEIASLKEIKEFTEISFRKKIQNKLFNKNVYKERKFEFNKRFIKSKSPIYIKGYFQSEKYFEENKTGIKKELSFKIETLEINEEILKEIENSNSVSIHIRRGDYLNKNIVETHGVLGLDYYNTSIAIINSKITEAKFFIFTDSTKWVENNINVSNCTIVSNLYSQSPIQDLFLMSKCKHNIIANSSFSWWGAWLNENVNKIVVAPKKWFGPKGPKSFDSLYPDNWIKI